MRNKVLILLILSIALILRLLYFRDSLTFFYDQARDALVSMEIWQTDPLKILGPQTDFKGLHHGPLYWYMISPFYFFTGGNVWVVRLFLIALNLTTIYFIYDLTKSFFNKKSIALTSSFLFAISFEAVQYARWLSNPAPALLTSTISFWALYKLIKGKSWALVPLLISWGLSIQLQLFMLYQIFVFIIIWLAIKGFTLPKIPRKSFLVAVIGFLATISTYILSEIKFNFQGTKAFLSFFKTQTLFGESFINTLNFYIENTVKVFFLNLWGANLFFAGLMGLATILVSYHFIQKNKSKKQLLFLLLWLLSPIIINLFTGPNANYITLGTLSAATILTAFFLDKIFAKKRFLYFLALLTIIAGNLNLILSKNKEGEVLFAVQKQMILGDELKVIDWIYKESEGKPFRLNTITSPLFINTTWAHLFNWYAKSHYRYMPIWWGETQVDVPGAKIAFADEEQTNLHFLIIEPTSGGDDNYIKAVKLLENTRSEKVKTEKFGYLTVEKRRITTPRVFTSKDVIEVVLNTDLKELQKVE